MVFQATNRYVNIAPVVARLASEFGMSAVMVTDEPENTYTAGIDYWLSSTDQIIVTRNQAILQAPELRYAAHSLPHDPQFRLWTDDFYNLLSVLKWQ